MKPQAIGIVGGAGPLAGAALLDRIISISGSVYGCYKDADFPKIILISYPFSEMLTPEMDEAQVRKELKQCLNELRSNGASVLAIACNTLHVFLDPTEPDIVHLPKAIGQDLLRGELPLVLCTSTSARFGLHRRYFPCVYPDSTTQERVDQLIDRILRSEEEQSIIAELSSILRAQTASTIILGCTELSLFTKKLTASQTIIDPLEIVANHVLERSFIPRVIQKSEFRNDGARNLHLPPSTHYSCTKGARGKCKSWDTGEVKTDF
jgi:aspartate racemase